MSAKPFIFVHHALPLVKVSSHSLRSLQSHLNSRSQAVKVGFSISPPVVTKKVPPGFVLGPVPFKLMVDDLLTSPTYYFLYVDDTVLFVWFLTI